MPIQEGNRWPKANIYERKNKGENQKNKCMYASECVSEEPEYMHPLYSSQDKVIMDHNNFQRMIKLSEISY